MRNGADPLVRDNEIGPLYLALRNGKDAVVNLLVAELQATYGDRWKQVVQFEKTTDAATRLEKYIREKLEDL